MRGVVGNGAINSLSDISRLELLLKGLDRPLSGEEPYFEVCGYRLRAMLKGLENTGGCIDSGWKPQDEIIKGDDDHKYNSIVQRFEHPLQKKE